MPQIIINALREHSIIANRAAKSDLLASANSKNNVNQTSKSTKYKFRLNLEKYSALT